MITCPLSKDGFICAEILGLEDRKSSDNSDEEKCEETRLWDTEHEIWSRFRESFLEHLECREEDDEESDPLDRRKLFEFFRDPSRCNDHEDD